MNMRSIVSMAAAAVIITAGAEAPKAGRHVRGAEPRTAAARFAKLPEAERQAKREEAQRKGMELHGGVVEREGVGAIAVVNCQKRADLKQIADKVESLRKVSRMAVVERDGTFDLKAVKIPDGVNAAVFVVDDPSLPLSLVAVESKWGMMNVSPLLADSPSDAKAAKRVGKEFVRVASLTFGGGCTQYSGSPLQPAFNAVGLDEIVGEGFTIDFANAMSRNLVAMGMRAPKRATYRKACEEGWAAAPTNEFQKAVWDKVHSLPTEPIKIKPESKKIKD